MDAKNRNAPVSSLRRADPRALILTATGASFCFSFIQNITVACACLALVTALAAVCRQPWRLLLKRLAVANFLILFIWLTVPWTVPGESVVTVGPLHVSREGLVLAALVTIKCNAILLVFLVFVADLNLPLIGYALERLRVPVKLIFLFLFTCRYIHVIGEEWKKLQTATALRGFLPRTSMHTYGTIANMLGLTVINSIDRSHRIYEAMLLRGFTGTFHTVTELKAGTRDIVFTASFFFILVCLLSTDIYVTYCNV